jgi:hypothetical protein
MLKPCLFAVWSLLATVPLAAQEELAIDTARHCLYAGERMPNALVRFAPDSALESLRDEILHKTGDALNFEMMCANVPTIAAVIDGPRRYILYSRRYFNTEPDRWLRLALIAHEIGHHVNEHRLGPGGPTEEEEMEADEFMGFALCLTGVPVERAESVCNRLALASGIDSASRRLDIMRGFHRGEASLRHAEHASWFEDNVNEVIRNFPRFPLPAPKESAQASLDAYFGGCRKLYDADRRLRHALDASGYHARRYFYVPDGFAMITRLEQFNRDGTCKGETMRWSGKITRCEDFSVLCYLNALLTSEPGYFRMFVFIVTPVTLAGSAPAPTRSQVTSWLDQGANKLPPAIGDLPFGGQTNVTALIYEFRVREGDREPIRSNPSNLEGIDHLHRSKITKHLRQSP